MSLNLELKVEPIWCPIHVSHLVWKPIQISSLGK
jgi:hypothetical protein